MKRTIVIYLIVCLWTATWGASVIGDSNFDTGIQDPSYRLPHVAYDEAHNNTHRLGNTFKPFADILRNDGYVVESWNRPLIDLATGTMRVDIFVTCNALGKPEDQFKKSPPYDPAYTQRECLLLERWVDKGGSLLIITDHFPWSYAMEPLLNQFGVIGSGVMVVGATENHIVFHNNRLQDQVENLEPLNVQGVGRVKTFSGQALSGPSYASCVLLFPIGCKFSAGFNPLLPHIEFKSQGVIMEHGKGRIAIFGEAAMFSAQTVDTIPDKKIGMNTGDNDNKNFLLSVFHWLSRSQK